MTGSRRPARAGAALALLSAAICASRAGSAQDDALRPITLRWRAPAACPDQAAVSAQVDRLLGSPPDPTSPRYLSVDAEVQAAQGGGWRVQLTTDMAGAVGTRTIDAPTCAALADAAALVIALTFDPDALGRQAAPPPAPAEPPPRVPQPPPVALPMLVPIPPRPPPAVATPPERRRSPPRATPRLTLGGTASISVGTVPRVGYGIGGALGILRDALRADLEATFWPDRRATHPERTEVGGDVRLFAVGARACWLQLRRPLELGPCLGLEIGSMSADGFGVSDPSEGATAWLAPSLGLLGAWPVAGRLALRLDVAILTPLHRPPFQLENVGVVHRAAAVAGKAGIGGEVRF